MLQRSFYAFRTKVSNTSRSKTIFGFGSNQSKSTLNFYPQNDSISNINLQFHKQFTRSFSTSNDATTTQANNNLSTRNISENERTNLGVRGKSPHSFSQIDGDPEKWKGLVERTNDAFHSVNISTFDPATHFGSIPPPKQQYEDYNELFEDFLERVVPNGMIGHNWKGIIFLSVQLCSFFIINANTKTY
jgi:hypothetical protein